MSASTVARASAGSLAILTVSFLAFITMGLPDGVVGVAWPSIREAFARSQAAFGLILLVNGAACCASGLLAARLSSRVESRTILVVASLIVVAGLLAFASAPGWPAILLAAFLVGTGSGAINTAINTYAAQNFSPRHVNWLHASYSLGAAVGPLAMTAVIASGSTWRLGYLLVAAAPVGMVILYLSTARHWRAQSAFITSPPTTDADRSSLWQGAAIAQFVLFFCYSGLELTLGRWCYTVLTELRGMHVETAGLITSVHLGSIFAGRVILGALLDRFGADPIVRLASITALSGALCFALGSTTVAALGLVLAGFSLAPIFPTLIARTAARFPARQVAHVVAGSVAAGILGCAIVPYLAGLAASAYGLTAVPVAAVIAATALLAMHEGILRRDVSVKAPMGLQKNGEFAIRADE